MTNKVGWRRHACAAAALIAVAILALYIFRSGSIDSMTLYSLDGTFDFEGGKKPEGEAFHNYPVLGQLDVTSLKDRREIVNAVKQGIAEYKGQPAKCFWPRHGIRFTQRGKTIEYLICFECNQLTVYRDREPSHVL